jgi:predicted transcriptional regulator of viral defense system
MRDVHLFELLEKQWNRVSLAQMEALGYTRREVSERVLAARLRGVHQGVFAGRPFLDDQRGRWMAATLTAPESYLSHASSAALHGFWDRRRPREAVTRPGNGGPRRLDGLFVYRSMTLAGNTTTVDGIPTTTPERAIIEMAPYLDVPGLARAVREALRIECTTSADVLRAVDSHAGRRGTRRVLRTLARFAGLPVSKARSGAEIRALIVLREAGRSLPRLNEKVAGEEADLSWVAERLIIEVDGGPFHQDVGEDVRKEAVWHAAGWRVVRIPSDDIYDAPQRLLAQAPPT